MTTGGDVTSCVRHAARSRFFMLFEDYLRLTNYNFADASALRVLETKTNDLLVSLRERGKTEISQNDLWMTLLWNDYEERSLHLYDSRSYQNSLPRLEKLGYVKSRYVKLDEFGRLVRDRFTGRLFVYATYKQAQCDRDNPGTIVKQYLYLYNLVNAAIDKLGGGDDHHTPPPPSHRPTKGTHAPAEAAEQPAGDESEYSQEEGPSAREGNPRALHSTSSILPSIVTDSTAKFLGDSPNYGETPVSNSRVPVGTFGEPPFQSGAGSLENAVTPLSKDSNNKNQTQESDSIIPEESAAAAAEMAPGGADFQHAEKNEKETTTWSREVILALAAKHLAALPTNINRQQVRQNELDWEQAAKHIEESSVFRCSEMSDAEKMAYLERALRYVATPSSPCSLRRFMLGKRPDKPLRLWHVANNLVSITCEMEKFQWWPDDAGQQHEEEGSSEPVIEAPLDMDEEEADGLVEAISGRCPEWGVRKRRAETGGYLVEFTADRQKAVRLFSPAEWSARWQRDPERCWALFRTRLDAGQQQQQAS